MEARRGEKSKRHKPAPKSGPLPLAARSFPRMWESH